MNDNFSEVEQRVKRYWFSDGIGELAGGGMFLLLSAYFGIPQYLGEDSPVSVILQSSLILIMIGGVFLIRWLVTALKTRLTYPRTGYVEYRVDKKHALRTRTFTMAIAMVIAFSMVLLARSIQVIDSTVLVTGLVVGVVFILLRGKSYGVQRFYVHGALSVIVGVALSFSNLPNGYSLAAFYGVMGLVVMVSGGWVLFRYLKENPLQAEEAYE
jgi:uncharacterized membrane protein YcfT